MKKNYAILLVLCLLGTSLMAQTVSSSTLEFKYCMASYNTLTKHVNANNIIYPYEWEGLTWTSGGTVVVTKVNARGCDSIITYTLDVYTPCSKPFTVSSGGQKVYFSPGNLQYQAKGTDSQSHWRFAENQWVFIGDAKGNTTSDSRETQSYWIDLFAYGTSGKTYMPWRHTTGTNWSPQDNIYNTDNDWGVYNNAALGNPNPTWRTLKKEEWEYLINNRTDKLAFGTVNGKKGIILLPDEWPSPSPCPFTATRANYTTNTYTELSWQLMEIAGAVFLPCAGYRSNSSGSPFIYGDQYAYYWSSTLSTTKTNPYCFHVYATSTFEVKSQVNYMGYSVRLVRNQ